MLYRGKAAHDAKAPVWESRARLGMTIEPMHGAEPDEQVPVLAPEYDHARLAARAAHGLRGDG